FEHLAGGPVAIGLFNLVPILFLLAWTLSQAKSASWSWGPKAMTLPLFFFTVWALLRLVDAPARLLFIFGGDFLFVWLVYLYCVNRRPPLKLALASIIVIQGLVGCLQFVFQRDLGLTLIGELPLNPAFSGVTVLRARGLPWLRAYGLTAHPNLYGALLALCLLLLLVWRPPRSRQETLALLPIFALGLAGLFFSFSRTAWLAGALSFLVWLVLSRRGITGQGCSWLRWLLFPTLILIIALALYGDLVFSRVANFQEPLEARSINQRLYDAGLALQLARMHPLLGVGLGRNVDAAARIAENAERVHNVLLLAAAELGMPGLILVLWLLLAPLRPYWRLCHQGQYVRCAAGLGPWLLVLLVNQLDTTLWLTANWQTAILFGLAAGNAAVNLLQETKERPLQPARVVAARSEG
ncbi:MAG TPA: O-antigen ligase family protein, partial [Candidatus Binatia bacterium]|nr:O-antigen ligase family protein [Candidatus Binatia bacterium]